MSPYPTDTIVAQAQYRVVMYRVSAPTPAIRNKVTVHVLASHIYITLVQWSLHSDNAPIQRSLRFKTPPFNNCLHFKTSYQWQNFLIFSKWISLQFKTTSNLRPKFCGWRSGFNMQGPLYFQGGCPLDMLIYMLARNPACRLYSYADHQWFNGWIEFNISSLTVARYHFICPWKYE